MGSSKSITIELSEDAALVLDSLIRRLDEAEGRTEPFAVAPAERAALWALEGALECQLDLFRADYDRLLDGARRRLCEKAGL